jgi:hypothetical protein
VTVALPVFTDGGAASRSELQTRVDKHVANVSRVLSEWRRRKFVTGSSGRYCLNNLAALKREMKSGHRAGGRFGATLRPGDFRRALPDSLKPHGGISTQLVSDLAGGVLHSTRS